MEKGNCKVSKDGKDIFMVKDGDYFGEVSLLEGANACCTVKAAVRKFLLVWVTYDLLERLCASDVKCL